MFLQCTIVFFKCFFLCFLWVFFLVMSSGHRLLSAFRFLSYPIKIIKVIIRKHKISKSKDKKICRDWGSNLQLQNFGTEVYDLTTATAQLWQILMIIPIYINGQCPIIKTCSDVTLNLSSKYYKYHNVFKFQNGPYRIMPSGVIALC